MKKVICIALALILVLSCFAGCSKKSSGYRIAIVQQLEHSSLDEIRHSV